MEDFQFYFQYGHNITIFFEQWKIASWQQVVGLIMVLLMAGAGYEAFKVYRLLYELSKEEEKPANGDSAEKKGKKGEVGSEYEALNCKTTKYGLISDDSEKGLLDNEETDDSNEIEARKNLENKVKDAEENTEPEEESGLQKFKKVALKKKHLLQTLLHFLQLLYCYLLIMLFMTYSIWICCSIIIGSTLGYYLFGWKINSVFNDVKRPLVY